MGEYSSGQRIKQLGHRLERIRLLHNIPQRELASLAGISARTLRRLESGEGGSLDSFIRLLIALDLDENLSVLIPDHTVRPMERLDHAKKERQRARRAKSTTNGAKASSNQYKDTREKKPGPNANWTWGDEQS